MSGFWEKVLGTPEPGQPTPPPATDAVPWWQRTVVDVPQSAPPAQPVQQPAEPQTQGNPQESMAKTQWAKQTTGNCPSCASTNYHAHPDAPNARARCYDCGYPISQSGTGVTLKGNNVGPVKSARQTEASKTNDFNPHQIFDRLG
jgi:hypothetical protein